MPGLHGQGLAFGPEPGEVDAEDDEQEGLQRIAVVQGVAGLAQRTKQVAGNEDHTEHQHAFIEPASHPAPQAGGGTGGGEVGGGR